MSLKRHLEGTFQGGYLLTAQHMLHHSTAGTNILPCAPQHVIIGVHTAAQWREIELWQRVMGNRRDS
jgi:hypothetical protein